MPYRTKEPKRDHNLDNHPYKGSIGVVLWYLSEGYNPGPYEHGEFMLGSLPLSRGSASSTRSQPFTDWQNVAGPRYFWQLAGRVGDLVQRLAVRCCGLELSFAATVA